MWPLEPSLSEMGEYGRAQRQESGPSRDELFRMAVMSHDAGDAKELAKDESDREAKKLLQTEAGAAVISSGFGESKQHNVQQLLRKVERGKT